MGNPRTGRISEIHVQLDRVQLVSWAPQGRKPPLLPGFKITRDCFVRRQTTTTTYARSRQYASLTDGRKVYWQYCRQKGWLKPWKMNFVADDRKGLSYEDLELVLKHCRFYRFLALEIAIDFLPSTKVNNRFIRRYATFGKSRRRAQNKTSQCELLRNQKS